MRIATWNIACPRPGSARATALLAQIAAIDADVWILTETHQRFSPGHGYRLAAASAGAPDLSAEERWTQVWVREGWKTTPTPTADAERTACARIEPPGAAPLYVYGTVLPWLGDRRRSPLAGNAAFAAAVAEQAVDWRRLRAANGGSALCVAGDFNQDLLSIGHYYGSTAGRSALGEALDAAGLRCVTGGTDDPVARLRAGHASVDHVCIAEPAGESLCDAVDLHVWPSADQLGARLSDHFGVAVTLRAAHRRMAADGGHRH